jgi:outer membrane lipoprotein SlyB
MIFPGVGTAIGGFIGAMAGGIGGRSIISSLAEFLFD